MLRLLRRVRPFLRKSSGRSDTAAIIEVMVQERSHFAFPDDARWNDERQAVEFGAEIGEYRGVVRVPRQVFRHFHDGAVMPERCMEAYHLNRTRFARIAEAKLARPRIDR